MDRRRFLSLTGTFTGGALLIPDFLHAMARHSALDRDAGQCLVFLQLNGGNDGLNTFIPYEDPLYGFYRPAIGISKDDVLRAGGGMGLHPSLTGLAQIQQQGQLSILQNVGYPGPVRSHFRSLEIWQTAAGSKDYLSHGWLGRYLDLQCVERQATAGINIDATDNLALRGSQPHSLTVKDPGRFGVKKPELAQTGLSGNPQLDFVRRLAESAYEGSEDIRKALTAATPSEASYPKTQLGTNFRWIANLIKGDLNSRVYYTSANGYDTHDNQRSLHGRQLSILDEAVFSFYSDMKSAGLLAGVTLVIFSEFGRRVKDNGSGTDHGTAAPMFVIGGKNRGNVIGKNPDLLNLDRGDLRHEIDFRSVYAALLEEKLGFDGRKIGIANAPVKGLF